MKEPDFINEQGVKFWLDESLTKYALDKGLKNVQVLIVEEKNGNQTRLITENGAAIWENSNFEAIAVHLDIMKLGEQMPEYVEFGNIVEENGKTIRENNLETQHKLQVGDLVEVQKDQWFGYGACSMSRERLWIVYCGRDCDGSILYWLAKTPKHMWNDITIEITCCDGDVVRSKEKCEEDKMSFGQKIYYGVCGGFSEDQLTKIEVTEELKSDVGALHW